MMPAFGMGVIGGFAGLAFSCMALSLYAWRKKQKLWVKTLEENKALRLLNERKDALLATTTHELRTPLNGIIGLAEALLDEIQGPINGEQQADLALIVSSGARLNTLVDDILDYYKMEEDELSLQLSAVNPFKAVNEVIVLIRPLLGKKKVKLLNCIPADGPPILADENRFLQILHNLIGNAVKYTREGQVTLSASNENNMLSISVSDTGLGIPVDELGDVFQTYTQSGIHAGHHGGCGLGLAVTKKLVGLHGGHIHVRSEQGKGSTFTFTMPISHGEPASNKRGGQKPLLKKTPFSSLREREMASYACVSPVEGHFHILVADDDLASIQTVTNYLSDWPYLISQASDGKEALDLAERETIDLVVLDYVMEDLSGLEVCRALRERYPAHELPIIFLTACNQVEELLTGFDADANDYLVKPVSRFELLSRIKIQLKMLVFNRGLEQQIENSLEELETRTYQMRATLNELDGRNAELEIAEDMMRSINGGASQEEILQRVLSQGLELFSHVDSGSVLLWNEARGRFEYVTYKGLDINKLRGVVFTYDDLAGRRIKGLRQLGEGIAVIHNFPQSEPAQLLNHLTVPMSLISLSLKVDGKTWGFLTLHSSTHNLAPDASELQRLIRFKANSVLILSKVLLCRELLDKKTQAQGGEQYARHLQKAMLPDENFIAQIFEDHFILNLHGSYHSGDFHWFHCTEDVAWVAVGECCDKGLAASILSIITFRLLNSIVVEYGLDEPGRVLEELNLAILDSFRDDDQAEPQNSKVKLCLCCLNYKTGTLLFSGADRPIYHVCFHSLNTTFIEGCPQPLGEPGQGRFETHKLIVEKGDGVYLTSDGFENLTNEDESRYGPRRLGFFFRDLIVLPFHDQKVAMLKEVESFSDKTAYRDDITVFGFKI